MKRSRIQLLLVILAILAVLFILFALRSPSTESISSLLADGYALEKHFEMSRHEKLLVVKSSQASLSDFTSDGCSGGLSVGWEYLAAKIPDFEAKHGTVPAWHTCCETHDVAYHSGGPEDSTAIASFEARRKADLILKACVVETGKKRIPELSKEYNISETEFELIYQGIANMMYGAVRIGGLPCTDLPWRWGYGWPQCK